MDRHYGITVAGTLFCQNFQAFHANN